METERWTDIYTDRQTDRDRHSYMHTHGQTEATPVSPQQPQYTGCRQARSRRYRPNEFVSTSVGNAGKGGEQQYTSSWVLPPHSSTLPFALEPPFRPIGTVYRSCCVVRDIIVATRPRAKPGWGILESRQLMLPDIATRTENRVQKHAHKCPYGTCYELYPGYDDYVLCTVFLNFYKLLF